MEINNSAYFVLGRNMHHVEYASGFIREYNGWYVVVNLPFITKFGEYMNPYSFQMVTGDRYLRAMLIVRRARNIKWGVVSGIFWRPSDEQSRTTTFSS